MAGDEIVADWLGDIYGDREETSATVKRFYVTSSRRFRSVDIFNEDATHYAYIGKYYSLASQFATNAGFILPLTHLKFEFVDLHELGHLIVGTSVYLKVLGLNEY